MNEKNMAETAGEVSSRQVRLVTIGAAFGALALVASIVVSLTGLSTPEIPQFPAMQNPLPSSFPSNFPTDLRIPDFVLEKAP
ncbi:hypothetical protein [Streptosporangium saharense]|uniref:hypothetical protein n=1 Tax=Streptosporangium saharense TaxID=1706840 RepID=UPI00367FE7CB